MKKCEIKVGDLVKDKWAAANKVPAHIVLEEAIYLPAMGIIKNIIVEKLYKTKKVGNKIDKIPYEAEIAEIEWMEAYVPQLNARTNPIELQFYKKHKTKIELRHLTLFNSYYKSLLKRWSKKALNT